MRSVFSRIRRQISPAARRFRISKTYNINDSSYPLTGLNPNTTYYFRVQAVNASGTANPPPANGSAVSAQSITTPKPPKGDLQGAASGVGPQSITIQYQPPHATSSGGSLTNDSTGGLYNNIFLWVAVGQSGAPTQYMKAVLAAEAETAPQASDITATFPSGGTSVTVPSMNTVSGNTGALLQILPESIYPTGTTTTYTINGLPANQTISVMAMAVYWVSGQPQYYLTSTTPTTVSASTVLNCPTGWNGITSIAGTGTTSDFFSVTVGWPTVTVPPGVTCALDVSTSLDNEFDWSPSDTYYNSSSPYHGQSCSAGIPNGGGDGSLSDGWHTICLLSQTGQRGGTPGSDGGKHKRSLPAAPGSMSRTAQPPRGLGDTLNGLTTVVVPYSQDTINVKYTLPSAGLWDHVLIFRETGSNASTQVVSDAYDSSSGKGPAGAPYAILTQSQAQALVTNGQMVYADTAVPIGSNPWYVVKAAVTDGSGTQGSGAGSRALTMKRARTTLPSQGPRL